VRANLAPVVIGFVVVAVGISFGANAGYAINPARDFGPRLFADIAGYGKIAIPGDYGNVNSYLWIPIIGPFLGGMIGALIYDLTIHDTLLGRGEQAAAELETRGETVVDETDRQPDTAEE
jgi:glycerol uptake facilitator protein